MRIWKTLPVLIVMFCATPSGRAQDTTPAWEIFGGYTFQRSDFRQYFRQTPIIFNFRSQFTNFEGFRIAVTENKNRRIGGTFDFAAHYNMPEVPGVVNRQRTYSLMYGPRLTFRWKFLVPFGQGLVGAGRSSVKVTPVGPSASDWGLAFAGGTGIDVRIGRRFAVRVGQAEYFRLNSPLIVRPHGFRATTGFVWNIGEDK